jgi:hypothetical protein
MILKPCDLKVDDVVCYYRKNNPERGPFCDMVVNRIDGVDIYLRRPYINADGEARFEELYWHRDANFQFLLIRR